MKTLTEKEKIAVIGAGISGLSASFLFQQRHEVHLFEGEARLGGHANTAFVGKDRTPVDTGFIVFNDLNYPNLTGFFNHLGVDVADSEMTLSVKFEKPNLEWGGTNFKTLIAQKRNLLRPKFWSMIQELLRFNKEAAQNLVLARKGNWTLRELLARGHYGRPFMDWYLVPMGAAIWSTPTELMLDFPAETFLQFCLNHRLLQVNDRPIWKTVRGGSIQYVRKAAAHLRHVYSGAPVELVKRTARGVEVVWKGQTLLFDAVIFATHPPQTLEMMADANPTERRVLESFLFQRNVAQLHSDTSFLPKRRSLWSAWNFHQSRDHLNNSPVSLSYWMNVLQPLGTEHNMIVSLNSQLTPTSLHKTVTYEHPLFSQKAIAAQSQLAAIQGEGGIFHCGAWTRYGFHEDGILSAVQLAKLHAIPIPWSPEAQQTKALPLELTA